MNTYIIVEAYSTECLTSRRLPVYQVHVDLFGQLTIHSYFILKNVSSQVLLNLSEMLVAIFK